MRRILLLTNKIPHYRVPLYSLIGDKYELTIAHTGKEVKSTAFDEIILSVRKIGPFVYYKGAVNLNSYDVVVVYLNVRLINLFQNLFSLKRRYKLVVYGIGVSASYTKKYDSDHLVGSITKWIVRKADAAIFYDNYPAIKYASKGVRAEKMFVANNTVAGNRGGIALKGERNSLLFIGSLYKEKGIVQLLKAYDKARKAGVELPTLNIIGEGPDRVFIENWIADHHYGDLIKVFGAITDESRLALFFNQALCCISPQQAGLSVQKSFSYGVPFVTSHYPISGGEFTSIIDGVTGFFYDGSVEGLVARLIEVVNHPDLDSICENCKIFYDRFRSPHQWAQGFCGAIEYVLK